MSESTLVWKPFRENLGKYPGHHLQRIENSCGVDQPDVEYCILGQCGWIELKYLPQSKVPKKATSILRIDHYTDGQRGWHKKRAACGGRVWVFLRVVDEFFLFKGADAEKHLGITWTLQDCRERAVKWWDTHMNWPELRKILIT